MVDHSGEWITDDQAGALLYRDGRKEGDRWELPPFVPPDDPMYMLRPEAESIRIVKCCVFLGSRVTDVISGDAWFTLVEKVARLENAIALTRLF